MKFQLLLKNETCDAVYKDNGTTIIKYYQAISHVKWLKGGGKKKTF
jgi:hypothetical protein